MTGSAPQPVVAPIQAEAGTRDLLYLYAVVPAGAPVESRLVEGSIEGLVPGCPLFPIRAGTLVAAVSLVPDSEFEEKPLNALLTDLGRLGPYAVRHEQAVRTLLAAASAVIPVAFGRVYRAPETVRSFLQAQGGRLQVLLSALEGKQEWGLKIIKDGPRLWRAAEELSPRLAALAREESAAATGRAYLLRRQRERDHAVEAARIAAAALDSMLDRISNSVASLRVEEVPAQQPSELEVVLKAALLVDVEALPRLAALVDELNDAHRSLGLTLDLNGPWAPYSFLQEGIGG